MNRRNFIRLGVAAALAPVAFAREPGPYIGYDVIDVAPPVYGAISQSTYSWWRNNDESRIDIANDPALIAEMERLYLACLNAPAPPNLIVWRT